MNYRRQFTLSTLAIAFGIFGAQQAVAQTYPTKTIRIVVPFSAGGGTDVLARALAERASAKWNQPIVIENKPGANGSIAAAYVAAAPRDGYTLLFSINSFVLSTLLYEKPIYKLQEFVPVALVANNYLTFYTSRAIPGNTEREILSSMGKRSTSYASFGVGSFAHLYGELLAKSQKYEMLHVPYKGEVDAVAGLIGGQVESTFLGPRAALQIVPSGKARVFAVAAPNRIESLPNAPTFTELGLTGLDRGTFLGLLAPVGTPASAITRWEAVVKEVLLEPTFRERMKTISMEVPSGSSSQEFAKTIDEDVKFWTPLIKSLNLKLD
jgi:tripartite-type tricarboxylate transporter receptor subunit TctC